MSGDDATFLAALENATLPNVEFRHADHIRAAYLYVSREGYPFGADRIREVIAHFAAAHGMGGKYHVTLTLLWARLVAAHVASSPVGSFAEFLSHNSELTDKSLPLRYYSPERLFSPGARQQWREPDRTSLPNVRPWAPSNPN